MTAQWLSSWHNLIFIVPFGLALLYLALYTLSGWTFGDADADAHGGLDTHGDPHADHDVDGVDHAGHHHNGTAMVAVLSWFGAGRVPLSLLLMLLMLAWGVFGFAANSFIDTRFPQFASPWLVSIPLAAIGASLITRLSARLVGRYFPTTETYARRRHDFLGQEGLVVLPVDHRFGMVAVRDAGGELFQLPCRLEAGDRVLAKDTRVKLVAYNANEKLFYVLESEFGDAPRPDTSARSSV